MCTIRPDTDGLENTAGRLTILEKNTLSYRLDDRSIFFDGPYISYDDLKEEPGIILLLADNGRQFDLIHVEISDNLKDHIRNREWMDSWTDRYSGGALVFAAHYSPERGYCSDIVCRIKQDYGLPE